MMNGIATVDKFWSLREDLHAKYDGAVTPGTVDMVLDSVACNHEDAAIAQFAAIFVEREAVEALERLVNHAGVVHFPRSRGTTLDYVA